MIDDSVKTVPLLQSYVSGLKTQIHGTLPVVATNALSQNMISM